MKNLLIIIDPKNGAELSNVERATKDYPGDQESVIRVSQTSWLIEPHKSIGTASALIENAQSHNVPYSVFEIDDVIQLSPADN